MTEQQVKKVRHSETRMVPYPSKAIVPERDLNVTPILETHHLGIQFGGLKAVDDVNLIIGRSEIAGLIGPNGAGKTTVFNMLTKVYEPTEGSIIFNGKDMSGRSIVQASKMGIARTFQNIRLFGQMTVEENVRIGLHNQIRYTTATALLRLPSFWIKEHRQHREALELLSIFGMENMADVRAGSLPYGAQRRLEIVRALATGPKLLLLDEPAAGMNPQETDDLGEFIVDIKNRFNLTVFMIEHHMNLVMDISDRIYVLDFGKQIAEGTPEEIQKNPVVIAAYLGVDEE